MLLFIIALATGIFVDALAALALDTLSARGATGATLAVGLFVTLFNSVSGIGIGHGSNRFINRLSSRVAGRYIGTDLLAQLTTFAALGDFLLFFLLGLGTDDGSFNGFYRFNDQLGTGLTRCTGLTSRTRGARFAFLTRFAGLTFQALFSAHFTAGFTFLTGLTLLTRFAFFTRTTIAVLTTLAIGRAFALLAGFRRVAVAAVVVTTGTLATATVFITLVTMTFILARFPRRSRFLGRGLDVAWSGIAGKQTRDVPNRPASAATCGCAATGAGAAGAAG